MYIQITTRCNMECGHCCYSCTSEGEDMTMETFERCLEFDNGGYPSIGGGEPTVHPQFELMLLKAIAECETPWLATNGKIKKTALLLAKLAKSGVISCELSQDAYHDPIDPQVVQAFDKPSRSGDYINRHNDHDFRGIRNVQGREINAGRCNFGHDEGCVCEGWLVRPNGDVHHCGCMESPCVGNINDPDFDFPPDIDEGCYQDTLNMGR